MILFSLYYYTVYRFEVVPKRVGKGVSSFVDSAQPWLEFFVRCPGCMCLSATRLFRRITHVLECTDGVFEMQGVHLASNFIGE